MTIAKCRSRLFLVAAAGIVIALAQASQSYAESIYQGPWSISANSFTTVTYFTPKYTSTTGNVYTCVKANSAGGISPNWSFELLWWNGGRKTVVWKSGTYTTPGTHCSPKEHPTSTGNPEFLDAIVVDGGGAGASAGGLWDLYLSY